MTEANTDTWHSVDAAPFEDRLAAAGAAAGPGQNGLAQLRAVAA